MDDFDAWARLSARLLRRSALECARIIREAGADKEWHRADAHWYQTLLEDVEAGRSDRIDQYRLICVEDMGQRRRSGEPMPSPLDALRPPSHGDADITSTFGHDWTVQDYAWLCAELEHFPEREGQIWGARGITDEANQRSLKQTWERRLDGEEGLRSRYDELLAGYREVLRQGL